MIRNVLLPLFNVTGFILGNQATEFILKAVYTVWFIHFAYAQYFYRWAGLDIGFIMLGFPLLLFFFGMYLLLFLVGFKGISFICFLGKLIESFTGKIITKGEAEEVRGRRSFRDRKLKKDRSNRSKEETDPFSLDTWETGSDLYAAKPLH